MSEQNPMSLDKLPEYLKSLKESNRTGGSCVVDMGMIQPEKKLNWIMHALAASVILTTLGAVTYNFVIPRQLVVDVALNKDVELETLPEIIANIDKDAVIIAVIKKEDGTHELKISTRKNKRMFLDSIKNNINAKKID